MRLDEYILATSTGIVAELVTTMIGACDGVDPTTMSRDISSTDIDEIDTLIDAVRCGEASTVGRIEIRRVSTHQSKKMKIGLSVTPLNRFRNAIADFVQRHVDR